MYTDPNFTSGAALKRALAAGEKVTVFQPGLGSVPTGTAEVSIEGPHYPKPHSWYLRVRIQDGVITKVVKP